MSTPATSTTRCRTGRAPRRTSRPRPARSRPRSGLASRPRAAPSRRSGPSSTAQLTERVEEIEDAKARGETIWPVIDYADIEAGTVSPEAVEHLHRRGCVVIRGTLRARPGARLGPGHRRLRRAQRLLRRPTAGPADDFFGSVGSRPEIYPVYWSTAADGGAPERPHGARPVVPQPPVDLRVRRRAVVRPRPGLALPRPHPPPPAGRELRRPRRPPRPRHARPVDDERLPAGVPPPVRRLGRAVRPVGRLAPHRRPAVPRHDHVARCSAPSRAGPRCPTWRSDQGVLHTVPIPEAMAYLHAAPAAVRRRRGRHVRHHRQPGLPGHREVAPAAHARPQPASRTSRPATPSGGTAT